MLRKIINKLLHSTSSSSHKRHYSSSRGKQYKRYSSSDHGRGNRRKMSSSDLKYGNRSHGQDYYKNRHRRYSSS